jgi:hypothetical protein
MCAEEVQRSHKSPQTHAAHEASTDAQCLATAVAAVPGTLCQRSLCVCPMPYGSLPSFHHLFRRRLWRYVPAATVPHRTAAWTTRRSAVHAPASAVQTTVPYRACARATHVLVPGRASRFVGRGRGRTLLCQQAHHDLMLYCTHTSPMRYICPRMQNVKKAYALLPGVSGTGRRRTRAMR